MSNERPRTWLAGSCSTHRTLTLDDASVHCTPALAKGWWQCKVRGDATWLKADPAVIAAIGTDEGDVVTWAADGEGEYFWLPDGGYIAAKRAGSVEVTVHVQRRG